SSTSFGSSSTSRISTSGARLMRCLRSAAPRSDLREIVACSYGVDEGDARVFLRHLGVVLRQFGGHKHQFREVRGKTRCGACAATRGPICPPGGSAPEAGLEPATRRLTAGCSTS